MDVFKLSRNWFDWCFENSEKINPNHSALYFFCIEHCNRMGWKEKFGFPMEMAKDAIGIKNYRTYSKTFQDLVNWGFIKLIEKSKNQYSANVIAIVENTKANTKALDKAIQKHSQKQVHGIVGIDIQETLIPETLLQETNDSIIFKKAVEWMKENSSSILKLSEPFTEKQFTSLRKDFTNDQIKHLLLKMHNWKPLLTKSKSANLTFRYWSKKEVFKDMIIDKNKSNSNPSHTEFCKEMTGEEYLTFGLKPEYR
jgi:hypothetical protein